MAIVEWDKVLDIVGGEGMEGYRVGYVDESGVLGGVYPSESGGALKLVVYQSLGLGCARVFYQPQGGNWVVMALEDRGRVLGAVMAGSCSEIEESERLLGVLEAAVARVHKAFRWVPELMHNNRSHVGRQTQVLRSIEEQRRQGFQALHDYELERVLMASIRAGDRDGSRMVLNELLTPIFMQNSSRVVLQAQAVELVTRLTRTALEDNPMLTLLWGRWREWTSAIVTAASTEGIARAMMETLEGFIEGVFVHGARAGSVHVHRALAYISEHYTMPISLREVSREVGISPSRLAHLFREELGRTVLEVVHEVRVRRARALLERTDMTCAEVAYEVGYTDQSYFTQIFRRLVGAPPRRYRISLGRA